MFSFSRAKFSDGVSGQSFFIGAIVYEGTNLYDYIFDDTGEFIRYQKNSRLVYPDTFTAYDKKVFTRLAEIHAENRQNFIDSFNGDNTKFWLLKDKFAGYTL